jgi:serine/threonine protein kinase
MVDSLIASFSELIIVNVEATGRNLGAGSFGSVAETEWNGTVCAAKQLHVSVMNDVPPKEIDSLMASFHHECKTWAKLRHPNVVQLLGVYFHPDFRMPWLVMEKMDTSLNNYLDKQDKTAFRLLQKTCVLRQVAQALAYLHGHRPPLVHHDLSTNNILLNEVTFVTKLTDFGMARALSSSTKSFTRTNTVKGTLAFLPPEAMSSQPHFNEKLDVFSFGNVIASTLSHIWPKPSQPTRHEGDSLVALTEYERRQHCISLFDDIEREFFVPLVRDCLENRADRRPPSVVLVHRLCELESVLPDVVSEACPSSSLVGDNCGLMGKIQALEQELRESCCDRIRLLQENTKLKQDSAKLQKVLKEREREMNELREAMAHFKTNGVSANGFERSSDESFQAIGECKRTFEETTGESEFECVAVSSREGLVAVTEEGKKCVTLFDQEGRLIRSFGSPGQERGQFSDWMSGIAFDRHGNIVVSDTDNQRLQVFSIQGNLLRVIPKPPSLDTSFSPHGVCTDESSGLIFTCDTKSNSIAVFKENGNFCRSFGSKGTEGGRFLSPWDVAMGQDGLLYISDRNNSRIQIFTTDGVYVSGFDTLYEPCYLDVTASGHIIASSGWTAKVMVYTTVGNLVHVFGEKGTGEGEIKNVHGIAVDSAGIIYIADRGNKKLKVF